MDLSAIKYTPGKSFASSRGIDLHDNIRLLLCGNCLQTERYNGFVLHYITPTLLNVVEYKYLIEDMLQFELWYFFKKC